MGLVGVREVVSGRLSCKECALFAWAPTSKVQGVWQRYIAGSSAEIFFLRRVFVSFNSTRVFFLALDTLRDKKH
jgi:hypothetical protein